jgi:hypothetical protein
MQQSTDDVDRRQHTLAKECGDELIKSSITCSDNLIGA